MSPSRPDHDPHLEPMDALHRQQLSALIDGELGADQARFLIRRLEHDEELSGCQERWQIAGDVLRGRFDALAPVDFAARVAAALPASAAPPIARRGAVRRWPWAAGGALAASAALLAVLGLTQRAGVDVAAPAQPAVVAAPVTSAPAAAGGAGGVPDRVAPDPVAAAPALAVVAAVEPAVASPAQVPVRRIPARPARAAPPAPRADAAAGMQLAAGQEVVSPFALPAADPPSRPWPRSTLPASGGSFNVRLPEQPRSSPFAAPASGQASPWPAGPSE